MQLLLLDPDQRMIRVFQDVFESWGFRVTSCSHHAELKEVLHKPYVFDAVVTEIDLPGAQRGTLIPYLRQRLPELPLVVLTDRHSVPSAVRAMKDGADDFIQKSFEVEKLRERLFKVLAQKSLAHNKSRIFDIPAYLGTIRQSLNQTFDHFLLFNRNLQLCDSLHRESCEHISEAVLMLDSHEKVILINRKMRELLAIPRENITGWPIFQRRPELRDSIFYSCFQAHRDRENRHEYAMLEFLRPGDRRHYLLNLKVISIKSRVNGEPLLGMIFIATNIQEKTVNHS